MTELRIGVPNEKQRRFLLDRHRHIAYGGARGGGKSWAVRTKAKLLALRYAGIKLLIVRRTLRNCRTITLTRCGRIWRGLRSIRRLTSGLNFQMDRRSRSATARATAIWDSTRAQNTTWCFSTRPGSCKGVDRRNQRLRARDERAAEADVLYAEPGGRGMGILSGCSLTAGLRRARSRKITALCRRW